MNDHRLREFSREHLAYEIHELFSALELFAKQSWDPMDALTLYARNHFLEGVVIHARCLYEFLYFKETGNPKRADDALAIHYFDGSGAWERLRPEVPLQFLDFYERASQDVVHLTYTRMRRTEIARRWDLWALASHLYVTLKVFIEKADPEKLDPVLKEDLDFWRKRIENVVRKNNPSNADLSLGTTTSSATVSARTDAT